MLRQTSFYHDGHSGAAPESNNALQVTLQGVVKLQAKMN